MTRIYLIRHAEAEGNIYRRAHGHYNGLVTPKGERQIKLLEQRFAGEQIDAVYSSDLTRTMTTAMAIAGPRDMRIITDKALREVDMGSWEDRTWGELEVTSPEMNKFFNSDPAKWDIERGEPYANVSDRMFECLTGLAQKHDGETLAVFSHGFAIRTFLCRLRGVPSERTGEVPYCDNTAVTMLTYEGWAWSVQFAGDNSHLGADNTTIEKQSWWKAPEKHKPENLRYMPLHEVAGETLMRIFKANAGQRAHVDTQYAAYLGDEPVGIIGLDTARDSKKGVGWLSYIHVVPQRRKNTFGTQLIGQAVSDYRKLGRDKLRIELSAAGPGLDFLLKCGFNVHNVIGAYYQMEKNINNKIVQI